MNHLDTIEQITRIAGNVILAASTLVLAILAGRWLTAAHQTLTSHRRPTRNHHSDDIEQPQW